jgi:molecular chaperone GrpE
MDSHNHGQKHDKSEHPNNHHANGHQSEAEKKHLSSGHSGASLHAEDAVSTATEAATTIPQNSDDAREKDLEKIEDLESKVAASNDKYLRLMAEFDNFKRRTAKEYQQLIEQANEKLMKDIIEIRETFERAFKSHTEGADLKPFLDGMKLVFSKLDGVLQKHGLEVYSEAGQEFDPQLHDAMMNSAHEQIPEHHIAEVLEKGYKLRGKVIKHSRVIVSSGKPAQKSTSAEAEAKAAFEAESGLDEQAGAACD